MHKNNFNIFKSPMSNIRVYQITLKDNVIILWDFFWNPNFETESASHLNVFSAKDPKIPENS